MIVRMLLGTACIDIPLLGELSELYYVPSSLFVMVSDVYGTEGDMIESKKRRVVYADGPVLQHLWRSQAITVQNRIILNRNELLSEPKYPILSQTVRETEPWRRI